MGSRTVMRLDGAKEFRAALIAAGDDLSDLRQVNQRVAKTASSGAIAPRRSGHLASTVRALGSRYGATIKAGSQTVKYANPIHWGWADRKIKPQPWIIDHARRTEPRWISIYTDYIEKTLAKIKGL